MTDTNNFSHYASFDANGLITAWYNTDIYPPKADGTLNAAIPSGAVQLSEAQWLDCITNSGLRKIVNGAPVACAPPAPDPIDSINSERDRRLYGGFIFSNVAYQTDEFSIDNILGCAQLAFMAIVAGAKQGDTSWNGGSTPFTYIAMDNSKNQMDAQTVVAFAKAAASFRETIIYSGRALKDAVAAGQSPNIYADTSWGQDSTSPTSTSKTATPTSAPAPAAAS